MCIKSVLIAIPTPLTFLPLFNPSVSNTRVFLFCDPLEFKHDHLYDHGFGTILWKLAGSPVDTQLKTMASPPPDQSAAKSSAVREMAHKHLTIHGWLSAGPVMCRPRASERSCYEVKVAMSCPKMAPRGSAVHPPAFTFSPPHVLQRSLSLILMPCLGLSSQLSLTMILHPQA